MLQTDPIEHLIKIHTIAVSVKDTDSTVELGKKCSRIQKQILINDLTNVDYHGFYLAEPVYTENNGDGKNWAIATLTFLADDIGPQFKEILQHITSH